MMQHCFALISGVITAKLPCNSAFGKRKHYLELDTEYYLYLCIYDDVIHQQTEHYSMQDMLISRSDFDRHKVQQSSRYLLKFNRLSKKTDTP